MVALPQLAQEQRGRRLTRSLRRRDLLASGAGGILAGAVSFAAAAAEPVAVVAEAIGLDPTDPRRRSVGRLEFLGGVILRCRDPRFGGWSDLWLDPGSDRAVMVSDRGRWLDGRLAVDAAGGPAAFVEARLGTLIDLGGRPLPARNADCEALTALPDGGFAVAFEQNHRIWRYPAAEPPFTVPPVALVSPLGLAAAPPNGGIEALASLGDGRLIAFAEWLMEGENHVGWIGDGDSWRRVAYRAAPHHAPTGACLTPDGDLLVLERGVIALSFMARIVRVPRARLDAPEPIVGETLARLSPPLTVDNFEGIAARRGADGRTRVYVVADDNFLFFQRTLLLGFAID